MSEQHLGVFLVQVLLLLTPDHEHDLQLQILPALAKGMGIPSTRERLRRVASDAEIWRTLAEALPSQGLARGAA